MTNQLDHYISNHIKSLYRHKLFSPILYMILLIVLWIIFPIGTILSPKVINEKTSLDKLYKENDRYVSITLTDLKFTGYTQEVLGQTHGYYYYTIQDGCCNIVLLSPKTSEEGLPNINKVTVHAKIQTATKSYHTLLSKIAADLNWTDSGIYGESSSYYIPLRLQYLSDSAFCMQWTLCHFQYHMLFCIHSFSMAVTALPAACPVRFSEDSSYAGRRRTGDTATAGYGRYVYYRAFLY